MGILSLSNLFLHRCISALVFAEDEGWQAGIRQLFDIEVFNKLMASAAYNRTVYGLKKYKILEGLFESYPQLLLQTYFVMKWGDNTNMHLFYFSIITSLISLAHIYIFPDVVSVGWGFLRPKKE